MNSAYHHFAAIRCHSGLLGFLHNFGANWLRSLRCHLFGLLDAPRVGDTARRLDRWQ
jgi:hypothetical protein